MQYFMKRGKAMIWESIKLYLLLRAEKIYKLAGWGESFFLKLIFKIYGQRNIYNQM